MAHFASVLLLNIPAIWWTSQHSKQEKTHLSDLIKIYEHKTLNDRFSWTRETELQQKLLTWIQMYNVLSWPNLLALYLNTEIVFWHFPPIKRRRKKISHRYRKFMSWSKLQLCSSFKHSVHRNHDQIYGSFHAGTFYVIRLWDWLVSEISSARPRKGRKQSTDL